MPENDSLFHLEKDGETVRISGELSIYSAASLKEEMLAVLGEWPDAALNLSDVHEIDTAGLQVLLAARQEAEHSQHRLRLTEPSQAVLDLLALYRLSEVLS